MKKFILLTALSLLFISFSASSVKAQDYEMKLSPEQTKMMIERSIEMMKAQQKDDCKDSEVVSCLGISENKCEKVTEQIMNDCMIPIITKSMQSGKFSEDMALEIEKEHATCSLKVASKNAIDPKKYLMCVDKSDEGSYDEDSAIREMINKS